jgi:hypothetical protein
MYYLLAFLLFIVVYYVFMRILSSVVKGCLTALLVVGIVAGVFYIIQSTKAPVYLFDMYKIDNLRIEKINN